MFESITDSLNNAFRRIAGKARISEGNVQEAVREVRVALLEADVNVNVTREFVAHVREQAMGERVLQAVDPGEQFIKIVHDELVQLLGGEREGIRWQWGEPTVVMLCGLQGCGKTTTAAKLARRWQEENHRPMFVAADVQRPAAVEQLKVLGEQVGVPVHTGDGSDPVQICTQALEVAKLQGADTLILDTAGRLHVDEALMFQLETIVSQTQPHEILFVCDAMIGQSAVDTAAEFKKRLPLTGAIMTKLDSDARGGSALSLRQVTGVPIKYVTVGEKLDALEEFHPDRMAGRILGMGDVVSLVEKAQSVVDEKQAAEMQQKLLDNAFTLEDFQTQMGQVRKMGGMKDVLGMLPGVGQQLGQLDLDDKAFGRIEAIMQSMTPDERQHPEIISDTRRNRIAKGSGTAPRDVAGLLKQFGEMRKIVGKMGKHGMLKGGGMDALGNLMSGGLPGVGGGGPLFGSKKQGSKAQQKAQQRVKAKRRKREKQKRKRKRRK